METVLLSLLAFVLVLLNGFFVAAEFAIVKLRLTQAQELAGKHGWTGRILHSVRSHLDAYLSACQLGITLASLALGWIGEPAFAHLVEPLMLMAGIVSPDVIEGVSFSVAFVIISFLHIVIGELMPKSLAIRQAERVSLWTAPPLFLFYWLMYPFIWVLNGTANWLLRGIGVEMHGIGEDAHSASELKQMLVASHRHGELAKEEADILSRTLELSDLSAGDLMRPAIDMVSLDLQQPLADNLGLIDRHGYSRYPVFDGGRDRLKGFLHVKDLYAALRSAGGIQDLRTLVREPNIVHRDTDAFELFLGFRKGQPHFAFVTDDGGTVMGFLTFDHVLQALFGSIRDEFHRTEKGWSEGDDGSYVISGALPIHRLERLMDVKLPEEGIDSVGGLVMARLENIPKPGERVAFEQFDLVVLKMRGPRVHKLKAIPKPKAPAAQ